MTWGRRIPLQRYDGLELCALHPRLCVVGAVEIAGRDIPFADDHAGGVVSRAANRGKIKSGSVVQGHQNRLHDLHWQMEDLRLSHDLLFTSAKSFVE
jgi:hypothetical protein